MKPEEESKSGGPAAEASAPEVPVERLMRLTVYPAETSSPANCRVRAFLGSDSLAVQGYLVRFLGSGRCL